MNERKLPSSYKGLSTRLILKTWNEIRSPGGTKAPKSVIRTMDEFLREYKLGIHGVIKNEV